MVSNEALQNTPDQSFINMKNEVEEKPVHLHPQILPAPDQTTKPTFDPIIIQQEINSLNLTITNQNQNISNLNTQYWHLIEQHDKYKNSIEKLERQEVKITELERQVTRIPELERQVARIAELERQEVKMTELERQAARIPELERQGARITELERQVARITELQRSKNIVHQEGSTYTGSSAASLSKGAHHLSGAARPAPISQAVSVLCKQMMLDEVVVLLSSKISGCTLSGYPADVSVDAEPPPVSPSAKVIVCVMQTTARSQDADKVNKYIEKLRSKGMVRGERGGQEGRGEGRTESEGKDGKEGKKGEGRGIKEGY